MQQPGKPDPSWTPPSDRQIATANRLLGLWKWMTAPRFFGVDKVPAPGERPVLFIANHTLMGILDTPLLMLGIYEHTGHYPRSMGDNIHFKIPGWRDLLTRYGAVQGSRDNFRELMKAKSSILVFPGGAREVNKTRRQKYQLVWRRRYGFALLAIEAQMPIVPVAAVGADDMFEIVLDTDDLKKSPVGEEFMKRAPKGRDFIPPLIKGVGPTLLPIPQRFYFSFADPIESAPYQGREDKDAAAFELREVVREALQGEIDKTLVERAKDPDRELSSRIMKIIRP